MRLAALLLTLSAAQLPAAMFHASNNYRYVGTWNDGKELTVTYTTAPLSQGASIAVEGDLDYSDTHVISFPVTFPSAPAGAKNVFSGAGYNYMDIPSVEFKMTVVPIVADCGGVPCHYEPPATSGNGSSVWYWLTPGDILAGGPDFAGKTVDVSVLIEQPTFETFSQFAYNSKTTYTWGQSSYDIQVTTYTMWEMDTPEPSTTVTGLLAIGAMGVVVGMRMGRSLEG